MDTTEIVAKAEEVLNEMISLISPKTKGWLNQAEETSAPLPEYDKLDKLAIEYGNLVYALIQRGRQR